MHSANDQAAFTHTPSADQVIQSLNRTLDWYRQGSGLQQIATEPVDETYLENGRQLSDQVVPLAFDFARQAAQLISDRGQPAQSQTQNSNLSQYQGLMQAAAKSNQNVQKLQGELQDLQKQLATSFGKKRRDLESQTAETESELKLALARQATLTDMIGFVNGTSGSAVTGLHGQIEELAKSVPSYLSQPKTSSQQSSPQAQVKPPTARISGNGIWSNITDLFHLGRKEQSIKQQIAATNALIEYSTQLRTPLVAIVRQMIQTSDQLESQADTSTPDALAQEKQQLDKLTSQFEQVSATLVPLSKQAILLDLYNRDLANWRDSIKGEYREDVRNLLLRLLILAIIIGSVLAIGELWRRTIFRYIQDVRRRYQLLLLRRIALWLAIGVVLVFTFASELGSIVTFAGLITAGVAVALQNVIVSIVGYFLLIGKYGIRVGDRVQVSGVMGEVVDIGMVRFHLMELAAGAVDFHPTGRVVAFSNSIVFQPTAGIFKQIPGTSFVWHEIKLVFAAESDYHAVRDRINEALEKAFSQYRENLEFQRQQMERTLTYISASELKPRASLHLTPAGLEVLIRYPVVLKSAGEIDERLTRELFAAVDREPKLKLIGSEIPALAAA